MNPAAVCRLLVLVLGLGAAAMSPALAQQALTSQERADADLILHFYDDPRPERLVGFLERFAKTTRDWSAYPPVVGLFAVVFRAHADWIDKLIPATPDAKTAEAITAALQLSGQAAAAQRMRSRLAETGSDARLKVELADLPSRLEDVRITTPTHLDIVWGAFFASGSERYVRMIVDFLAQTANRSEAVALDMSKTTVALLGGPKDILGDLKGKYGEALAREIIFASSAQWALLSNARQHPIVDKVVTTYIAENPSSHAAKSLAVFGSTKK
jgi:hypothetical protein